MRGGLSAGRVTAFDRGRERISRAARAHRTCRALRLARGAQRCAEVHQRLIEVEYVSHRQHRPGYIPEMLPHRVRFRIAAADEHAKENARDVRVENGGAL